MITAQVKDKNANESVPHLGVPHLGVPHCHNCLIIHVVIAGNVVQNFALFLANFHVKILFIYLFKWY